MRKTLTTVLIISIWSGLFVTGNPVQNDEPEVKSEEPDSTNTQQTVELAATGQEVTVQRQESHIERAKESSTKIDNDDDWGSCWGLRPRYEIHV